MRKIDAALISELPPRARRIQQMLYAKAVMEGTTSACAENTVPRLRCRRWCGNYLRVRGEYTGDNEGTHYIEELPPRARRIHTIRLPRPMLFGTTSACAENTSAVCGVGLTLGNYLRVRGEYAVVNIFMRMFWELPPRARRIPAFRRAPIRSTGTTSACAENTPLTFGERHLPRNYLRVRGEYPK